MTEGSAVCPHATGLLKGLNCLETFLGYQPECKDGKNKI